MLCVLLAIACLQGGRPSFLDQCRNDVGDPTLASMNLEGDVEVHRFVDIPHLARRAETFALVSLVVEWGIPRIISPPYVQLTGRLTVHEDQRPGVRPLDWFQGIGILIARDPEVVCDWSLGYWSDDTFELLVVPKPDGSFTVCIDPIELHRRPGEDDWYSVGIVFYDTSRDTVYRPEWFGRYGLEFFPYVTTKDAASGRPTVSFLPQSLSKLEVPGPAVLSATQMAINAAPSIDSWNFDPLALVRAVNHLQALGKQGAIAALREFSDLSWRGRPGWGNSWLPRIAENIDTCDRKCVALILRLLFYLPGMSSHPKLKGVTSPRLPVGEEWRGRFPLDLHRGIPFLLVHGLGGTTTGEQEIDELIDLYEAEGVLRSGPITPDDNPLRAARELAAVPGILRDGFGVHALMTQAIRMLSGVEGLQLPTWLPWDFAQWTMLEDRVEELGIHWDPVLGRYMKR